MRLPAPRPCLGATPPSDQQCQLPYESTLLTRSHLSSAGLIVKFISSPYSNPTQTQSTMMAEPIGTTASIIDLLCKAKQLQQKFKDAKDIPKSFETISTHVDIATNILEEVQRKKVPVSPSAAQQALIDQCHSYAKDLYSIYEEVEKNKQSGWQKRWLDIVKSVSKNKVGTIEELWERLLSSVDLLGTAYGLNDLSDIKDAIAEMNVAIAEMSTVHKPSSSPDPQTAVTNNNSAHNVGVQGTNHGSFTMHNNYGGGKERT